MTGGQELIDELRGEITRLRAEVKRYVDAAMERNDALEGPMGALESENERLKADRARLDWLCKQTDHSAGGWVARESTTGRGYRLHQTNERPGHSNPRDAIDAAIARATGKVEFIVDSQFPEPQPPAPQMSYAEARAQVLKQMRECEERVAAERRAEAPAPQPAADLDEITREEVESFHALAEQASAEMNAQPAAGSLRTWKDSAAERLADEVSVLIARGVIDARSPAADAMLDLRDGEMRSPRSDRLAALEVELSSIKQPAAGGGGEANPGCSWGMPGCDCIKLTNERNAARLRGERDGD